jgi:arginyl-tRNA synthetase
MSWAKLEEDYRAAAARFKEDTAFAEASRAAVTRLQGGDAGARAIWEQLCQLSREAFLRVYHRLGVLLTDNDVRGESFYNSLLARLSPCSSNGSKRAMCPMRR